MPSGATIPHDAHRICRDAADLGLTGPWSIQTARGFLIEPAFDLQERRGTEEFSSVARRWLSDPVVETLHLLPAGESPALQTSDPASASNGSPWIHVLLKPGVTDPQADNARALLATLGWPVNSVRGVRSYRIDGPADQRERLVSRVLVNDAVEMAIQGNLAAISRPSPAIRPANAHAQPRRVEVPLRDLEDDALIEVSRRGQLALSLEEMKAIQTYFRDRGREPTEIELETLAQTWSEHCSHKTLKGRIEFEDQLITNLLRETVFRSTRELVGRHGLDWLVSVFADNSGVIQFDEEYGVSFKVETHNHPSAIDPYGGSNTGLGGVIRDALGTGRGAKPICNTSVFCVAPPNLPAEQLPPGTLHPRRVLRGVVAGVRDYGNRMGIPTVNGALVVDPRYVGNPLVFCGTVGLIPLNAVDKTARPGDLIVVLGGRTGRDGIHGATFSSLELTEESETVSGGAVQIGNPITQKTLADVLIQARDRALFRSVTDCGAGGFSSAIGEMGEQTGAVVDLETAPLKYQGLTPTEIWISEAQERMILAVPPEHWEALRELAAGEDVEATVLGRFTDDRTLTLRYQGEVVGQLGMEFLHGGRPDVLRRARHNRVAPQPLKPPLPGGSSGQGAPPIATYNADLLTILSHWDICSKEWIVRQYDHEVQARTVVKPLVGPQGHGPGDAAVILPRPDQPRGLAIGCGINNRVGDLDPYAMAGLAIDEAIRNVVAVGADPSRVALLDNFCWGNTNRPETLGSLVLAAQACHDFALAYQTPFISGKDSLNNEYRHGQTTLTIPPTLLISALGIVPDVQDCVTMDLKRSGNALWIVGQTGPHLAGSHWTLATGRTGGVIPEVEEAALNLRIFRAIHQAIASGLVRSCHDLNEGGLAVGLAEMALAGGLGLSAQLHLLPRDEAVEHDAVALFAETPGRFLLEVEPDREPELATLTRDLPAARIGQVLDEPLLSITGLHDPALAVVSLGLDQLRQAFLRDLDDDTL